MLPRCSNSAPHWFLNSQPENSSKPVKWRVMERQTPRHLYDCDFSTMCHLDFTDEQFSVSEEYDGRVNSGFRLAEVYSLRMSTHSHIQ